MTDDQPTYAETWADAINETYDDDYPYSDVQDEGEDVDAAVLRVLTKAADCLRGGNTNTFTGAELDLVRHLMPAHEVHQSLARRWVLRMYGGDDVTQEQPLRQLGDGPTMRALREVRRMTALWRR